MASINIEALENYMKNKGITQRKLAQKLNIDPSYFWRIMRGEKDGVCG
jgi:transcriptional regulator with XRE-family HTH domain